MVLRSDWWFSNSALCGWKDRFGNNSPLHAVSRCGQLLVYLPGFGPSSFVSLSQLVRQVYFQTRKGLAALPASKLNALKPRFPIRWYQWPRPSGLSWRHLHAAIQQPFCCFQQYKFFSLWCDRDTPAFFWKEDQLRCLGNWPPYTLPLCQH